MRIPVGNFGNAQQVVVPQTPVDTSGDQMIARAGENVAGALTQLARANQQERESMARAKATNALADHELAVKKTAFEVMQQEQNGEIKYQDTKKVLQDRIASIDIPQIDGAPAELQTHFSGAVQRVNAAANLQMDEYTLKRQQDDYHGQFVQFLDTQAKLAGLPGADIAAINEVGSKNAQAMAQKAGISDEQTAKYIQDWKDKNWFNHATEQIIAARNNLDKLKSVEHSLSAADGYYQGKLDTEKRDALLNHAMSLRLQLENKALIQSDRADARAQRALYEIDQQIATGVPLSAAQWDNAAAITKGTSFADGFKQRQADEQQVQQVLRMPLDQQANYVQQAQAKLMQSGGDLREIANVNRLSNAVAANLKQLQEQPLQFAQARTGEAVAPLDIAQLLQPGGAGQLVAQLHDRVDTINALQKQYGGRVEMKPLLDGEAKTLADMMSKLGPQQKVDALAALRDGVGTAVMVPMMKQVAKDDPMLAIVSGLTAAQTTKGRNVARVALLGDELLKSKQAHIPSDAKLNEAFQTYVGNAITTTEGKAAAMQVTNAIYAQLSAEDGKFLTKDSTFDSSTYERAIRLATGGIVDYNGGKVLPVRYGASVAETKDALRAITPGQVKLWGGVAGMSDDEAAKFIHDAPLESVGFGRYRVRAGAGLLQSNNGGAFEMNFGKAPATGAAISAPTSTNFDITTADQPKIGRPDLQDLIAPNYDVGPNSGPDMIRHDGSRKGNGYLGMLSVSDGVVATEISISTEINGKKMDIPTLVPTLTRAEVERLLTLKKGESIPTAIIQKAKKHAEMRLSKGLDVYATYGESPDKRVRTQ